MAATVDAPTPCCAAHSPEPGHVRWCMEPVDSQRKHRGPHWSVFRGLAYEWPSREPVRS